MVGQRDQQISVVGQREQRRSVVGQRDQCNANAKQSVYNTFMLIVASTTCHLGQYAPERFWLVECAGVVDIASCFPGISCHVRMLSLKATYLKLNSCRPHLPAVCNDILTSLNLQ